MMNTLLSWWINQCCERIETAQASFVRRYALAEVIKDWQMTYDYLQELLADWSW